MNKEHLRSNKPNKAPLLLRFMQWLFPKLEVIIPNIAHHLFVKLFFTPFRYPVPQKEQEALQQADKFKLRVDQFIIQCYSWGDEHAPVVLFVHGWAGRATQFREFFNAINKAGYRAVAFDGPAHGASTGKRTHLDDFRNTIIALNNYVGKIHAIIAHSFGGVASLYAIRHELLVKTLINIASPVIGDEIINTYLRTLHASPGTGEFFKQYVVKTSGKTFDEYTALHFIKHINNELALLLIQDKEDPEVSLLHAQRMKEAYPAATVHITEGLGHTRILRNEQVINICVTFINQNSSK